MSPAHLRQCRVTISTLASRSNRPCTCKSTIPVTTQSIAIRERSRFGTFLLSASGFLKTLLQCRLGSINLLRPLLTHPRRIFKRDLILHGGYHAARGALYIGTILSQDVVGYHPKQNPLFPQNTHHISHLSIKYECQYHRKQSQ